MIEILIIIIVIIVLIVYFYSKSSLNDQTVSTTYSAEYYRGLNYLLNNEDDKALKIFTDLIDVDSSTIETHLALGGVYRRRGEFDKAILIHQNLLSRPNLDKSIKNQSLYELSKDFFSAGLYDKSEKILLNLKSNKSYYESCNEYLLLTYELSKDWDKAITFSKDLKSEIIRNKSREILIAQYYCEKAMDYLKDEQLNKTITVLKKAVDVNKNCTRAYKLLFELNIDSNPELAFDYLHSLVKIDPNFILIVSKDILRLSSTHQNSSLDKKIYDMILNLSTPTLFSPDIYEFMFNYNKFETPSDYVSSINANIFTGIYDNLYKSKNDNQSFHNDLLSIIKENYLSFNCSNCGYSSKSYIWQCPSCNSWETIEPSTISDRVTIDG